MKKLLLFLSLALPINQVLSYSPDDYNTEQNDITLKKFVPKFVWDRLVILFVKIICMAGKVFNRQVTPDSKSDELVIISATGKTFNIKFLNLYQINKLKDKFVIPDESYDISKELYDKLKKLSSTNLEYLLVNGIYNIKLPCNQFLAFHSTSQNVEAVIISKDNLQQIAEEIWDIDYAKD